MISTDSFHLSATENPLKELDRGHLVSWSFQSSESFSWRMGTNLGVLAGKGTHLNKFLYFCTRYSEQYPLWVVLSQYKDNDILPWASGDGRQVS